MWNLKISNLFENQKRNWTSTKYFETSQKPRVIRLKFGEISLVLWNLINYCKIIQFLLKFCKSLKDFRKIWLKWLGKTIKHRVNFVNTDKWLKVGLLLSITLMKDYSIPWRFSWSQTFSFNEILSRFILFMTKIFCFTKISQLPT